jgi:nicotinamide riboside transporter PnuC
MFIDLEELAPHLLGVFMIALACIPLVFVWQDRGRKQAVRERMAKRIQVPVTGRTGLAGGR